MQRWDDIEATTTDITENNPLDNAIDELPATRWMTDYVIDFDNVRIVIESDSRGHVNVIKTDL